MIRCPNCGSTRWPTREPNQLDKWHCIVCAFTWIEGTPIIPIPNKYLSTPFTAPVAAMSAGYCSTCNSWSCTCASADPFKQMQDDAAKRWQELPRSVRLTYYLLAKAEFSRYHDISWEIDKAWKDEHK